MDLSKLEQARTKSLRQDRISVSIRENRLFIPIEYFLELGWDPFILKAIPKGGKITTSGVADVKYISFTLGSLDLDLLVDLSQQDPENLRKRLVSKDFVDHLIINFTENIFGLAISLEFSNLIDSYGLKQHFECCYFLD